MTAERRPSIVGCVRFPVRLMGRGEGKMRVVALLACGLAVGSCASMTRDWNDQVRFSSVPSEANVRTSTGFQCITPCQTAVGRKDEFVAVFSKPGYESKEVLVK